MKLEDTTVTRQSNIPSSPIIEIAEKAQQSRGKRIQRIFLKIKLKVTTSRKKTPKPNIFRSFLIVCNHADSAQEKLGILTVIIHNITDCSNILMPHLFALFPLLL